MSVAVESGRGAKLNSKTCSLKGPKEDRLYPTGRGAVTAVGDVSHGNLIQK